MTSAPSARSQGGEHRAERVPDQAVVGQSVGEQLVAEDEDFDAGAGDGGSCVVPGGGGEAEHGRGHQRAGGQQLVAGAALLAAGRMSWPGTTSRVGVQTALVVGAAVLAAQDGGGVRRDAGAGGDPYRLAVGERRRARRARRGPRPRAWTSQGPGPATAQPSMAEVSKDGQVGEGGERGGEDVAEGGVEGDGDGGTAAARVTGGRRARRWRGPRARGWPCGPGVGREARRWCGVRVGVTSSPPVVAGTAGARSARALATLPLPSFTRASASSTSRSSSVVRGRSSGVRAGVRRPSGALSAGGRGGRRASSAQRSARATALRAASATASGPPPARAAAYPMLETCGLFFAHAINAARKRVWIASPYFVPDLSLIYSLQLAALRGVDVRVMLPERPDHLLVYLIGLRVHRGNRTVRNQVLSLSARLSASEGDAGRRRLRRGRHRQLRQPLDSLEFRADAAGGES